MAENLKNLAKVDETVVWLNPHDITVVEDIRGRYKRPIEGIYLMAESLLQDGQKDPIDVRIVGKGSDTQYRVFSGFTRTNAGQLIRDGFYSPSQVDSEGSPVWIQQNDFLLKARVHKNVGTEIDELEFGFGSNFNRNELSPIDHSIVINRLTKSRYSQADLVKKYYYREWGTSAAVKVSQYAKLINLIEPLKDMVHEGKLSVDAALKILSSAKRDEEQLALAKQALEQHGKISSRAITEIVQQRELLRRVKSGEVEVETEFSAGDILPPDTDPDNPISMMDDPETSGKDVLEVSTATVEPSARPETPTGEASATAAEGETKTGEGEKKNPPKTPREAKKIPAPSPKIAEPSPKTLKQVKELFTRWCADENIRKNPWKLAFCEEMLTWLEGHTRAMVPRRFLLEIAGDPTKPAPNMSATEEQAIKLGEAIDML